MTLVLAVAAIQAALAIPGWALVRATGRRAGWRDAGLVVILGTGTVTLAVSALVPLGVRPVPATWALVIAAVTAGGLAVARRRDAAPARAESPPTGALATVACGVALALLAMAVAGGFRSSPWLDDTWTQWLPRGLAAHDLGLDPRLYVANAEFAHFFRLDYPLWWSALSALVVDVAPGVDLRAVNAELTLLGVCAVLSVPRLLEGIASPRAIWLSVALLALSPEFVRELQGGGADAPLAAWLGLFVCASLAWHLGAGGVAALTAMVAAGAAVSTKSEGLPLLVGFAVVLALVAASRGRAAALRQAALVLPALVSFVPWTLWKREHEIQNLVSLREALDPSYLGDRLERVWPSIESLAWQAADPSKWALLLPAVAIATALAVARSRDVLLLAPLGCALAGLAFWVWAYWSDPVVLDARLDRASYRVVMSIVLPAAFCLPLLLERKAHRAPGWAP